MINVAEKQLAKKYGVSRTTINKWVMVHQGIHNLPPTENQQKYYLSPVKNKNKNQSAASDEEILAMQEKIALLAIHDDQWLDEQTPFGSDNSVNNYFKWFHVFTHEVNHRGQIRLLSRQAQQSGSGA
jgi:uncharacterized damage-inducible protein DinB